jgi:hypothetical protein
MPVPRQWRAGHAPRFQRGHEVRLTGLSPLCRTSSLAPADLAFSQ